ncbi:hypothetical protein D5E86_26310 [Vibrio parahaemolyticus]|nr:hypothetical protein D5E86_26310 [Vibrio parahaemolyticus]
MSSPIQNILIPNRPREYLKCLNDMSYHERTYTGRQTSKYSEKEPTLQGRFFHIWTKRLMPKGIDHNDPFQVHRILSQIFSFFFKNTVRNILP